MSPRAAASSDAARLQARLEGILDAALDCIVTIDRHGCITEFNTAAERSFGYRRADVLGREMAELIIPPGMRERHRAGLQQLVATGESRGLLGKRVEVTALRADGTEFPVELTITRIGQGEEIFFAAYFREDAAARLQTRFTAILDAALDCIITIDHHGRVVDFNAAASRTFGYTREQAVGREMAELIVPPELRERHRQGLRRLVETGQGAGIVGRRIELPAMRADGHQFPVELAITRVESGGAQPFFTAYLRDITDRHRADAAQRESRSYFEKSFHSSPALMSIARAGDGVLIEVNPAFVSASGYSREEVLGRTTLELGLWISPSQRDRFFTEIRTRRLVRDFEADFRSKSGRMRSLLLNADLIELGGAPCMLTVGIDITERRRHELTQSATFKLSQIILAGGDPAALFAEVHRIIGELMPARNFYVALLNADRSVLSFPYFVDETMEHPAPRQPRNGVTEFVIDTAEPLLALDTEVVAKLKARGDYVPSGHPCAQWMGAPLIAQGRGIGVIAVQDYHNPSAYSEADKRLLVFVAEQTSAAMARQQSEAAQRESRRVQEATFQISRAVLAGGDLNALFAQLHQIVGGLISAKNFYVALLSADGSELSFPYFVDETARPPAPRKPGFGLTEYVLHTAKPLLTTADGLTVILRGDSRYQPTGKPSAIWCGAPLVIEGRAIGVITVQDYRDPHAYTEKDLQLLNFVAEQTAAAVHRRQSESALARAEERYRSIFENAVEGLYITSPDGRFLSANPALARMLGYDTPADLLAAVNDVNRQVYVQGGRRNDFFRQIEGRDELSDFESEVYRRDGSTLWVSESVRVVRNARGEIDHFEGVANDITQQREAARALQQAKEVADAASRAKSYFLASVSHELRTPLNGILGYTQILRRDSTLGEKPREGLRVIHESADHLLALINDVLDLSKIEAGRIELHAADFDLPAFAHSVEPVFTPRAKEKSILFETAVAADLPPWVRGDEQRLRQVVFNLLSNAVKFTKAGGVVFSVQRAEGERIRFSVSDTGVGMSEDDMGKLFEPFTQVGNTAQAAATGTGLGLAISRSLVERMGGQLRVESKPGWGSRFWFEVALPIAAVAAPVVANVSNRIVGYAGPRRRVLVVDDNAINRSVMVDMLAPIGFEVLEAEDGSEALERAQNFQPQLVLMDLRLPGQIDGLEATRRLRATAHGATARIIAVSASAYDLDRNECLAAGCNDFLAKPFREEDLWATVQRTLGLSWQHAQREETRSPFATVIQPPPAAEAAAIYDLAAKGDVVGIRTRAQALLAADPAYAPFAQGVLDLAARFKMKAIRQFVARYTS